MNIGQTLYQGQKLSQQLNLAPQLLNWLQLLQAPTQELSTMVQHELETNPVLELADPVCDVDFDDYDASNTDLEATDTDFNNENLDARLETLAEIDQEWRDDYMETRRTSQSVDDENEKHQYMLDSLVHNDSLYTCLTKQLGLYELSEQKMQRAEQIIGTLDDRGYLTSSLVDLAEQAEASMEAMQAALDVVQSLTPAGVGARDLRECLMLQVEDRTSVAFRLLNECFDLLTDHRVDDAADRLDVEPEDIMDALGEIHGLDPEPGLSICTEPTTYVEPDVFICEKDGELVAELNDDSMPHLRISPSCRALLEQKNLSEADMAYIRQKIRNGQFLIRGIHQRKETLLRVTREILRVQQEFFRDDAGEMVPLTMNKVAAIIGVHETTVSRAIANKYVSTGKGLMPMKTFFKSGYRCADGSALTPEKVKDLIDEMVCDESPANPMTDQQISEVLKEKGLKVARRTIAKYREEMDIPSSKERVKQFRLQQKQDMLRAVA
jgi:RNA polymerase sigma-54 factor